MTSVVSWTGSRAWEQELKGQGVEKDEVTLKHLSLSPRPSGDGGFFWRIEEHYKSNGVMPMSVLKQDARAALYLKLQLPVRTQPPRRSSTSGPTLRRPFPPDTRAYVVHHFTPNLTTSTKSPVQPNLVHKCDDKVVVDHLCETTRAWSVTKHDEKLRATDLHPSFIATLDAAGQASSSANASAYGSASTAASPSTTAPTTAGPSAAASAAPGPSALSLLGAKIPLPKFLWPRAKRDVVKADKCLRRRHEIEKEPTLRDALVERTLTEQIDAICDTCSKYLLQRMIEYFWTSGRSKRSTKEISDTPGFSVGWLQDAKPAIPDRDLATAVALLVTRPDPYHVKLEELFEPAIVDRIHECKSKSEERSDASWLLCDPATAERYRANTAAERDMDIKEYINFGARNLWRQGDSPEDDGYDEASKLIFITIREQWQESHLCPACWQEMTADKVIRFFAAGDGVEKKFHPSNLSIDCETPRCQGGLYEADNIRGKCNTCNSYKLHYTPDRGRLICALIGEAVATGKAILDGGFIKLSPSARLPRVEPPPATLAAVRRWCRSMVYSCETRCELTWLSDGKTKTCTLKVSELEALIAQDLIQIHLGISVPLSMISTDRIDPNGPYAIWNIRLTIIGFNFARNDCEDDVPLYEHNGKMLVRLSHLPAGVELPHMDWVKP